MRLLNCNGRVASMLGGMAGYILRSEKNPSARLIWLFGAGIGCCVLGLAWGQFFPINKYLWTSSFTLLLGGICFLLMALFYLVIDVWRLRRWAFGFVVIGMNPEGCGDHLLP